MREPNLSIITVNFNNRDGLIKTIQSVQSQTYHDYEHIIIDAASTDDSKEVILNYAHSSHHLTHWISEPDKGVYDGMNKGIEQAQGTYIYFLNSGDVLADSSVLVDIPFDGTKYICGNMKIIHADMHHENVIPPEAIDGLFLLRGYLPHPTAFIHHSLFNEQRYDTNYKIISDWIHMVSNIMLKGCSYKHVNRLVSDFDNTGISANNRLLSQSEREKWLSENISTPIYYSLMELDKLKSSELGRIIPVMLQKRARSQRKIRRVILFLSKILK